MVPLLENSLLLSHNALKIVNREMKEADVFWSAYLNKNKELGRSYPYPDYIVDSNQYYDYPFVAMGLQAFKF